MDPSPQTTRAHKVRAIDASLRLCRSRIPDAANYNADDPLIVHGTAVKAQHITELRQAVNMMRAAANLGDASFNDTDPTGLFVQKLHIDQLRVALDQARLALGLPTMNYTDLTISKRHSSKRTSRTFGTG